MQSSLKTLLLLSLLFIFTKQETKSIAFNGTTHTESIENKLDMTTFKITVSNSQNYLKIIAKGKGDGEQSTTNHIISYHKNEKNLNEREQLSQSGNETTIMFLSKKQIEKDFYISIQCEKTPCSYDLTLETSNYAELNLNDFISYYVTEENTKIEFKISEILSPFSGNFSTNSGALITIYAIGSLEIDSTLKCEANFTKHNSYSIYLIEVDAIKTSKELIFTVNGKKGDMINIGSYFIDGDAIVYNELKPNDRYVYAFLNKNILRVIYFLLPFDPFERSKVDAYFIGNLDKPLIVNGLGYSYFSCPYFRKCLKIGFPENTNYDEIVNFVQTYDIYNPKIFSSLQPQILGSSLNYWLYKEKSMAFFYNFVDTNTKNYEIYAVNGILENYYLECNNFPLCQINETATKNENKIKSFNSFSNLILEKSKIQNISPISPKQYLILNKCKKGGYGDENESACLVMNYAYSNDNKVSLSKKCVYNRYLLKNSQSLVKFYLFPKYDESEGDVSIYGCLFSDIGEDKDYYVISITVYSGSIEASVLNENKNYNVEKYEDNKQYFFNITKKNISDNSLFSIKINAKENSYYSIIAISTDKYQNSYINVVLTGSQYVFNLDKQKHNHIVLFDPFLRDVTKTGNYYIGFKSSNCKFNISKRYYNKLDDFSNIATLNNTDNYFQDIFNSSRIEELYTISTDEGNSKCNINIYSYKLKNKTDYESNEAEEIFLMDNVAQKFIFNENLNYIKFLYPNVQIENDLNVEIKNPGKADFELTIFFNNEKFNDSKKITTDNNKFTIKKDDWKKVCKENTIVCGISFGIYLESKTNATFEITASTTYNSGTKPSSKSNFLIFLIIVIVVIFLIIAGVVVFICKNKNKNQEMKDGVGKISFEEDRLINEI